MSAEIEKLMKIQGALDKNRFHLCINTNLESEYEWYLFMFFPDIENYFSCNNRPILDSRRSSIEELETYLKKYDGLRVSRF